MTRKVSSLLEKITSSEARVKLLVEQRHKELLNIIHHCNAIAIDDAILTGFLMFACNKENQNHPSLKEYKELAKTSKTPSRARKVSKSSTKTHS